MKIGIDIRPMSGLRTGIGRYVHQLIKTLAELDKTDEIVMFYNSQKGSLPLDMPRQRNFRLKSYRLPNKILNAMWAYSAFPKAELFTGKVDVFHSPSFQMAPTRKAANVLSVFDLIFLIHPEMAIPSSVRHFAPRIHYYTQRADLIVTISQATAKDISECLNIPPEKIIVIYPGTTPLKKATEQEVALMKSRFGIEGDYILFVSCLEPRKNLVRLLQAYERSSLADHYELVLAGPKGWHTEELFKTWEGLNCRYNIRWLDYVSDEYLAALYSGAAFFVYPSLLEGFGLPITEAMSVGCPVLTSNVSAMPEVAGDAAVLVDPLNVDSITQGMLKLSEDAELRQSLSQKGYERVGMFNWNRSANEMLLAYKKAFEMKQ
jgi:glycosyltransferase involved in cell wall biosynthesis